MFIKFQIKKSCKKKFYYEGKSNVIDLIDYNIVSFKKNKKILELKKYFENLDELIFPIKAQVLIDEYGYSEGKELGEQLKNLELKWIENNFSISKKEVEKVLTN